MSQGSRTANQQKIEIIFIEHFIPFGFFVL